MDTCQPRAKNVPMCQQPNEEVSLSFSGRITRLTEELRVTENVLNNIYSMITNKNIEPVPYKEPACHKDAILIVEELVDNCSYMAREITKELV